MKRETRGYVRMPDGIVVGPWGFPKVSGRCPACGLESLFLAAGGHVTCSNIPCPNPTAVADMLLPVPAVSDGAAPAAAAEE